MSTGFRTTIQDKIRARVAGVLLFVIPLTTLLLTGCGSDGAATSSTGTGNGVVTLRTISMFGGTDASKQNYERINKAFMDSHENVRIEDNSQSSDEEWKASVNADFAIGNEPDVIQFFTDSTADMIVSTGKLVSVEEIREVYPDFAADTLEEALDAAANTDGVRRAVPTVGYWEGLYCNKDLFDKYQVDLPTDYESFMKAVDAFQRNDIIPVAVSLSSVPHYWLEFLMLYCAGVEEYSSIPTADTDVADLQGWCDGLALFKTLRDAGAFPEDTDLIDDAYSGQLFIDKKAAMRLDGSWFAANVEDTENTVVIPFPGVPEQKVEAGTAVGGISTGFYITRKAWEDPQKRELAVEFVMAHTSREGASSYWELSGGIAQASVEVEPLEASTPFVESIAAYQEQIVDSVAPTDARIGEAYKTLVNLVSPVSLGEITPEEALEEVISGIQ